MELIIKSRHIQRRFPVSRIYSMPPPASPGKNHHRRLYSNHLLRLHDPYDPHWREPLLQEKDKLLVNWNGVRSLWLKELLVPLVLRIGRWNWCQRIEKGGGGVRNLAKSSTEAPQIILEGARRKVDGAIVRSQLGCWVKRLLALYLQRLPHRI